MGCLLALSWQAACGGSVDFDLTQSLGDERIIGNPAGGTLQTILPTPVLIGLDVKQEAVARKANGPVIAVTFVQLGLQTSATNSMSSFGFVQSVNVYIESTRANSSLGRQLVATQTAPPGKSTGFNLTPQDKTNLLPYLLEGSHLVSTATGTVPAQDVTFNGSFTLHVETL